MDLEVCPLPLLLVAADGLIVKTNQRADELFGYEDGELAGQAVEVLVPDALRASHVEMRNQFLAAPTTREMGTGRDLKAVRKDGVLFPVEVGLAPIDVNGQKMVMASVIDIRERKNADTTFRRALDAASSAMLQVDENGLIELVNKRAGLLFGYEPEEMLQQPIGILIPERFREAHSGFMANYVASRETRPMGSGRELFGLKKDGSEFPVEIGLTPVHGSAGKSTMATIIDITSRVQRERQINSKNEQLRRLNTELLEFAYSTSHDLKAPLASMQGLLQFCEQDITDGAMSEAKTNIERCRKLARRLAGRVEDILTLARSDVNEDVWGEVSVEQHIQDSWQAISHDDVTLTVSLQHASPLWTIPTRFDIILDNLLSNAARYQNPDETQKRVTVTTNTVEDGFSLSIEDNGIGIPLDHHQKIFRLFHRLSDKDSGGTGLGLPLVKKNVASLGGTIDVQSIPGKTAFVVTLPQDRTHIGEERV
ncbi:MAG: PAS domain S-box protein [Planctomycetaceae bacterium]